ncbi:MmyB family transcriptional regulator [Subtercola endophyticus]|uniref:MmyB family transcriptional regulator n=1 Tax=Subtercola endophyticus TaxID=2895559 RepID=UPI001E46DB15|nr:hypothetical protein [Subtercola endophyticus]UFS60413.1 hypothetical protein LQ955_06610 [Subtercola endophyticus]
MNADEVDAESRSAIQAMISSWSGVPALLCDRHMTVVSSNGAARALSPAFTEGINLARFTFLDAGIDRGRDMYDTAANQVAALLRESLNQHAGDAQFRGIVGDLSVMSIDFSAAWADDSTSAKSSDVIDFTDTSVGPIQMRYQVLRVPGNDEDSLLVWGPATEESASTFARLLASGATP